MVQSIQNIAQDKTAKLITIAVILLILIFWCYHKFKQKTSKSEIGTKEGYEPVEHKIKEEENKSTETDVTPETKIEEEDKPAETNARITKYSIKSKGFINEPISITHDSKYGGIKSITNKINFNKVGFIEYTITFDDTKLLPTQISISHSDSEEKITQDIENNTEITFFIKTKYTILSIEYLEENKQPETKEDNKSPETDIKEEDKGQEVKDGILSVYIKGKLGDKTIKVTNDIKKLKYIKETNISNLKSLTINFTEAFDSGELDMGIDTICTGFIIFNLNSVKPENSKKVIMLTKEICETIQTAHQSTKTVKVICEKIIEKLKIKSLIASNFRITRKTSNLVNSITVLGELIKAMEQQEILKQKGIPKDEDNESQEPENKEENKQPETKEDNKSPETDIKEEDKGQEVKDGIRNVYIQMNEDNTNVTASKIQVTNDIKELKYVNKTDHRYLGLWLVFSKDFDSKQLDIGIDTIFTDFNRVGIGFNLLDIKPENSKNTIRLVKEICETIKIKKVEYKSQLIPIIKILSHTMIKNLKQESLISGSFNRTYITETIEGAIEFLGELLQAMEDQEKLKQQNTSKEEDEPSETDVKKYDNKSPETDIKEGENKPQEKEITYDVEDKGLVSNTISITHNNKYRKIKSITNEKYYINHNQFVVSRTITFDDSNNLPLPPKILTSCQNKVEFDVSHEVKGITFNILNSTNIKITNIKYTKGKPSN